MPAWPPDFLIYLMPGSASRGRRTWEKAHANQGRRRPAAFSPAALFYFRICNGNYSGTSGEGFNLADRDAAWAEMTRVCGDLVGGIARKLQQQTEWRMELLDESRSPVFRIRVLGETLDLKALPGE
jgi:hypothetical protein